MTSKKRRRRTPDQIIPKLAEGNELLLRGPLAPIDKQPVDLLATRAST